MNCTPDGLSEYLIPNQHYIRDYIVATHVKPDKWIRFVYHCEGKFQLKEVQFDQLAGECLDTEVLDVSEGDLDTDVRDSIQFNSL